MGVRRHHQILEAMNMDIERIAREAGIPCDGAAFGGRPVDALRAFAALVAEECAKITLTEAEEPTYMYPAKLTDSLYLNFARSVADVIRETFGAMKPK
jgi:hypothetical protein